MPRRPPRPVARPPAPAAPPARPLATARTPRAPGTQTPAPLELAEQAREAEPPHHPQSLPDDAPVHLGRSRPPIDEQNRDLDQSHAALPAFERHLDLEGVAVRA